MLLNMSKLSLEDTIVNVINKFPCTHTRVIARAIARSNLYTEDCFAEFILSKVNVLAMTTFLLRFVSTPKISELVERDKK